MENLDRLTPPSMEGSLSYGWEKTKQHFLPLLLVVIVVSVVNLPTNSATQDIRDMNGENLMWSALKGLYFLLIIPMFSYSADLMFVQAIRDQKLDYGDLFAGFKRFLDVVLANLLSGALVIFGIVLLIIPGIWIGCRLAFVSYLVMDQGMGPVEAVQTSWRMTDGHAWKIFVLAIVSIFIALIGLICLIVGIFPALIWIKAAFASMYESVRLSEVPGELE